MSVTEAVVGPQENCFLVNIYTVFMCTLTAKVHKCDINMFSHYPFGEDI